jgi:UDP-N-acetylglucosamine 2-epimerase (non-hydrolysing)
MQTKILTVIGTRPEAIKMAPLIKKLAAETGIEQRLCVTGQHREMLLQVLDFFSIKPDYNLDIMKINQDLFDVTVSILSGMRDVLDNFKPSLLLVHGDTTTCMAASLAAFYKGVKVGHVEAGLRTWNLRSPFPEEANRVLTDRLAQLHFVPTENNARNLTAEGYKPESIFITGNTVIDSLIFTKDKVKKFAQSVQGDMLNNIVDSERRIILVTGHRRENFGEGFMEICNALRQIAEEYQNLEVVYPVHLNPNVQDPVYKILNGLPNVHLVHPLDYPDFVYAMKSSWLILTDSGGVQEEAPSLGKPVLVMRDTTERPEAVEAGTVKLVGANRKNIYTAVSELYKDARLYNSMIHRKNPYGDGHATERIINVIKSYLAVP